MRGFRGILKCGMPAYKDYARLNTAGTDVIEKAPPILKLPGLTAMLDFENVANALSGIQ